MIRYLLLIITVAACACNPDPETMTVRVPVIDSDFWRIGEAPDLDSLLEDGQWYISDIADFQGVKLARLRWNEAAVKGDD